MARYQGAPVVMMDMNRGPYGMSSSPQDRNLIMEGMCDSASMDPYLRYTVQNPERLDHAIKAGLDPDKRVKANQVCIPAICITFMWVIPPVVGLLAACSVEKCCRSMETRGSKSEPNQGTLLHWAVYHNSENAVNILLTNGATPTLTWKGMTPLKYAQKRHARPGLIAMLQKGAPAASDAVAGFSRGRTVIMQAMSKKKAKYAMFLNHHKKAAGSAVVIFRKEMSEILSMPESFFFVDVDNLSDLRQLKDDVKNSLVVVSFLSGELLTRPWCLVELYTAINAGIPIVAVTLANQGYNFEEAKALLNDPNFEALLEEKNPGAVAELVKQGIQPLEMASAIGAALPYIAAKPFDTNISKIVQTAMISDIASQIVEVVMKSVPEV